MATKEDSGALRGCVFLPCGRSLVGQKAEKQVSQTVNLSVENVLAILLYPMFQQEFLERTHVEIGAA